MDNQILDPAHRQGTTPPITTKGLHTSRPHMSGHTTEQRDTDQCFK